jgi:hypothetical protein
MQHSQKHANDLWKVCIHTKLFFGVMLEIALVGIQFWIYVAIAITFAQNL